MSTIRCPQCNLTNFATAVACKRCGYFFQTVEAGAAPNPAPAQTSFGSGEQQAFNEFQSAVQPANYTPQPQFGAPPPRQNYYQPQYQNYQTAKLKSGLAIASMVIGIVAFLLTCIGGFIIAPIGLILGIVALVKSNRRPSEYGGKGFAIAGLTICGFLTISLPVILAIAIPNLMAARRAANEGSAISTIRTLSNAEQKYMTSTYGKCGDIQVLIAGKLVDVSLAKNEKSGYRFMVVNLPAGGCEIHATPLSTSQGTRSFFYSTQDGVIRAANKNGLAADIKDLPLGGDKELSEQSLWEQPPNESAALSSLRTLHGAQATYAATLGQGTCGDLRDLARERLISRDLADGEASGYRFAVKRITPYGCDITATPASTSYQARSFYMGYDGVVRGKAKSGALADKSDPPLN